MSPIIPRSALLLRSAKSVMNVTMSGHAHSTVTVMTDTDIRCRHTIDIDDCACAAHARPEATVGVWMGCASCMDERRTNNKNGEADAS